MSDSTAERTTPEECCLARDPAAARPLFETTDDDVLAEQFEPLGADAPLPAWADGLIESHLPVGPRSAASGPPPRAHSSEPRARVLPFRGRVFGAALLAAAAALLWFALRPPAPAVPLDGFAFGAPVAALLPTPTAGSGFDDRATLEPMIAVGYRFELVLDWRASADGAARWQADAERRALLRWVQRSDDRGRAAALVPDGDEPAAVTRAHGVLDERERAGFDLGRWLYRLARHRAAGGPLPEGSANNAAALARWLDLPDGSPLGSAIDDLAGDPANGPLGPILSRLAGVSGLK